MDTNAPPSAPPPPGPPPPPLPPRPPNIPHGPHHPGGLRRLRRDRANGILGGVCAGVAETFGIDVTIVRVLWVVAAVMWIGVPAYIVAWIAVPEARSAIEPTAHRRDPGMLVGLALVGIGVIVASDRLLPHGFRFGHFGAPLLLICGGLAILLLRGRGEDDPEPVGPAETSSSERHTDMESDAETDIHTDAAVDTDTDTNPTTLPPGDATEPTPVPPTAWTQTAEWPAPPSARSMRRAHRSERRAQRPRSFLTPVTLSVLLIGGGIASLLQATGALDVNLTIVLAIGTCIVGAALLTAAFVGRAHTLILVGIVLLAATAISNTIDVPLRGGIGSRTYRPVQLSELQSTYELGIGQLKLDLREVPFPRGETTVNAHLGLGHLLVLVPSSVRVVVHAHAGAGSTRLFGSEEGGWPEDDQRAVDGTGRGVLQLNLRVGAGQVEVRRFEPGGIETILGGN